MTHATEHFRQRVRERIGADIDPDFLAQEVMAGIARGELRYLGRVTKDGLRAFRITVDHRPFVVIVSTRDNRCVTVLRPEGKLKRRRQTGGPISIEE